MTTKREKRLSYVRNRIKRMEKDRELGIKLLVRSTLELPVLRKEEARLMTTLLKRQAPPPIPGIKEAAPMGMVNDGEPMVPPEDVKDGLIAAGHWPKVDDDLGIPGFLRRGMAAQKAVDAAIEAHVYEAAHAVANAHNAPPTEEQKKLVAQEKRKVKEEHRQALLTGKKRKWPATGKAALAQLK